MKLKPDIDFSRFLQAVQDCRGTVWFRTSEGDSLNLKSTLSQMVFAVATGTLLKNGQGEIVFESEEDLPLLRNYLM